MSAVLLLVVMDSRQATDSYRSYTVGLTLNLDSICTVLWEKESTASGLNGRVLLETLERQGFRVGN